ncbi:unnamed protein product [Ilex paraguariensis]|uniref:Uncharacterized protein n=1 Tax=Ilex paraguariensis TaxID=185542 RepID=A0ABC8R2R7_9AQUA
MMLTRKDDDSRFFDKATIIAPEDQIKTDGSAANPWRLCGMQQGEEVKCLPRMIPIWVAGILFQVSVVQQQNYVVFQALQSSRRRSGFKIPAATYNVFAINTKQEDGITLLQRMGIGLALLILSMLVSALVETRRRNLAFTTRPTLGFEPRKGAISSMSFWYISQLALIGLAKGFTFIGKNELFLQTVPRKHEEHYCCIFGAVWCGIVELFVYINSINRSQDNPNRGERKLVGGRSQQGKIGLLLQFYSLVAALMALNLVYFLVSAKWYKHKETAKIPKT